MIPSLDELLASATQFSIQLRSRFRGVNSREGVLLDGPSGWAEFAPFDDYDDVAASRWLAAAIEAGWGHWPDPVRSQVPVNLIVPVLEPQLAAQYVTQAAQQTGCHTVKVKVAGPGTDLRADVDRLVAVKGALDEFFGEGLARIRIDANGAWSFDEAINNIRVIDDLIDGIDYVEQPCATLLECGKLRNEVGVLIAVDEGLRRAPSLEEAIKEVQQNADIVILKPIPLGGVAATLDVAERIGLPAVISGSLDSSVGLTVSIAAAAALPTLNAACGLGTGLLITQDVIDAPLTPTHGVLKPQRVQAQPGTALTQYWRARITNAYAHLS